VIAIGSDGDVPTRRSTLPFHATAAGNIGVCVMVFGDEK
jgi:hypothetical protein